MIHLGVCLLAFLALPIGLPAAWGEPPPGEPYLWQLGLFTVAIGLPFLAVSANAPLLQAWFARTGHPHGHDPYFLYAASNLGSLIALLAYPFMLEPAFGLKAAEPPVDLRLPAAGGGPRARLHADAQPPG